MTSMRALVTGGAGQLGRELARCLPDAFVFDRHQLDVTDRAAVRRAVGAYRPDVIFHTAAMTAVDACETESDRAMEVNALSVRWVVEAADAVGARVVYVSSDYVFDGDGDQPLDEWCPVGPQSVYGRSKLGGEQELRPCDTVARTAWLAGEFGPNIVRTVLRLANEGTPLSFVTDQTGSPSFTADVAPALIRLAEEQITGIVHVANVGAVTWFEYVSMMLDAAGMDSSLLSPIVTSELDPPRPAPRPAYSALATPVLDATVGALPPVEDGLRRLVAALTGEHRRVPRPVTGAAVR